jgi:hypothetical protein
MTIPPNRPQPGQVRPVSAPLPPAAPSDAPGEQVNPLSRAVHPREQYPLHFDFLMRDLYQRNLAPEEWQVIAADEVRLDEAGMDVEFTLLRGGTNHVWRRRVDVRHGKLLAIREC